MITAPAPSPSVTAARTALDDAHQALATLTRELTTATARASEVFASGTASEQQASDAQLDALTRRHRQQALAVQALQTRLEQAEHAAQLEAAATLEAQLGQRIARGQELVRDTAALVQQYDAQLLVLFEILAQLADADEEGLEIRAQFARLGREADFTVALPIPPGMTAYGQRLHEHLVFTQVPRGEELADGRVRHHHFAEWRRDHRRALPSPQP